MKEKSGAAAKRAADTGIKAANKGIHWEWRIFGMLSPDQRHHIESICSVPFKSKAVIDKYLWSQGCKTNVKIRSKTLKFKHLLRTTPDGFELWEEGKHLKYRFPLGGPAIGLLEESLCAEAPSAVKPGCKSADDLTAAISLFNPPVRCIEVRKHRKISSIVVNDLPIQLEIADILAPVEITSVAIESAYSEEVPEDRGLDPMRSVRDLLRLPDVLTPTGYLQFIEDLVEKEMFDR